MRKLISLFLILAISAPYLNAAPQTSDDIIRQVKKKIDEITVPQEEKRLKIVYMKDFAAFIAKLESHGESKRARDGANKLFDYAMAQLDAYPSYKKRPGSAEEYIAVAWQVLAELYSTDYIPQEKRAALNAKAFVRLMSLSEAERERPAEGLDSFFALAILTLSDSKTDVQNIISFAKRPYTSAAYYAATLSAVYARTKSAAAVQDAARELRAHVTAKENLENKMGGVFFGPMLNKTMRETFDRYGDAADYDAQERFASALCDESVWPYTKSEVVNDFNNSQNKAFKVNAALCLMNKKDSRSETVKTVVNFIEDNYFKVPQERIIIAMPNGILVNEKNTDTSVRNKFVISVDPETSALLRRRMKEALWENYKTHGNKYVKYNYSDVSRRTAEPKDAREVLFSYGVSAAEFVAMDLSLGFLTGGGSLTVSLPRWGAKLASGLAKNGVKTVEMLSAGGARATAQAINAKMAAGGAKAMAKAERMIKGVSDVLSGADDAADVLLTAYREEQQALSLEKMRAAKLSKNMGQKFSDLRGDMTKSMENAVNEFGWALDEYIADATLNENTRKMLSWYKENFWERNRFGYFSEKNISNIQNIIEGKRVNLVVNGASVPSSVPFPKFNEDLVVLPTNGWGMRPFDFRRGVQKIPLGENPIIEFRMHGGYPAEKGDFSSLFSISYIRGGASQARLRTKDIVDDVKIALSGKTDKVTLVFDQCYAGAAMDDFVRMAPADREGVSLITAVGSRQVSLSQTKQILTENKLIEHEIKSGNIGVRYFMDGRMYSPLDKAVLISKNLTGSFGGVDAAQLRSELKAFQNLFTKEKITAREYHALRDALPENIIRTASPETTGFEAYLESYAQAPALPVSNEDIILIPDYISDFVLNAFKAMPQF